MPECLSSGKGAGVLLTREPPKEELPTDKNEERVSCHSISVKVGHESFDPVPCEWDSLFVGVLEAVGDH